jgi:adenosylmethionine-8-amino-7-oxononanoate aminotransferase
MGAVISPIWHPFTQHGLGEPIPLVTHAEGASLYTQDGARVVDAISSWWVTTHGHAHPRIAAAIGAQASKLDQLIFAGWTHAPAQEVAQGLVEMVGTAVGADKLPYVFFSDSGSTCVEVALKMALGYWAHQGERRDRILVMQHSYHGDTIGAMSVGERGVYNAAYAPLLFDVGVIPFPHPGAEQACYDALEQACRAGAAAFIVEPLILGAGGMLIYPPQVLARMAQICRSHGALLIADEVMTGWGRTGTFLACEQAGVVPDILCLAKGLTGGAIPLAVTMASSAIYDAHYSTDRAKTFYHSSSYTANAIACAAACANLAIWREEPVLERIADLCARQEEGASMLAQVPGIGNVRQCGTILALDYAVGEGAGYLSDLQPRLLAFFREKGLLIRPLGNTAYLMPPYCISREDLAACHQALAEAAGLLKGGKKGKVRGPSPSRSL